MWVTIPQELWAHSRPQEGECRNVQPLSPSLEWAGCQRCGIWPREHPGEQVGSRGRMEAPRVTTDEKVQVPCDIWLGAEGASHLL